MKYLTRFFSLLLCSVLLFGVFSINANAESANHNIQAVVLNQSASYYATGIYTSGSGMQNIWLDKEVSEYIDSSSIFVTDIYIRTTNSSPIVTKGKNFDLSIYGLNLYAGYVKNSLGFPIGNSVFTTFKNVSVTAYYKDGSSEYLVHESNKYFNYTNDSTFDLEYFDLTATKDIDYLWVQFIYNPTSVIGIEGLTTYYLGYHHSGNLVINTDSEELTTSKSILSKITDGFNGMFTALVELPLKIGASIGDMVKSLFVPTVEDFSDIKDKFDNLLFSRFGALYEVGGLILDSWDNIAYADETNTIEFPLVELDLPDGTTFAFGGYDVKIVPVGFESFAFIVKSVIGIICTFAFINVLRKSYDRIIGG